jgi:four helix bundle protein
MAGKRDHTEFDVWQLSDAVQRKVRVVIERPSFRVDFDLRRQLKKASEGPCAHIAEGFSRFFPKDFARFVRIAKGSLSEVIVHIGTARDKGLATEAEFKDIRSYARRARGAATGLIRYLEKAKRPDECDEDDEDG